MEFDYDRSEEKRKEIISTLASILQTNAGVKQGYDQISNEIVQHCITIQPPEKENLFYIV